MSSLRSLHIHSFLICFLSRPMSTSCLLRSVARVHSRGIGPPTEDTNEAWAERNAGGTRIPNQRIGSRSFLLSFESCDVDEVSLCFSDASSWGSSVSAAVSSGASATANTTLDPFSVKALLALLVVHRHEIACASRLTSSARLASYRRNSPARTARVHC